VEGSGSVSSDPAGIDCGQDCQHDFSSGTQVTLTATPEATYELESWGGDCSGSASTCRLELTEDRAVTATFVQSGSETKNLSVTVEGSGSVNSDPEGIDCGQDWRIPRRQRLPLHHLPQQRTVWYRRKRSVRR
jgi:hypothetical protein